MSKKSLGICIGASTISAVTLVESPKGFCVQEAISRPHDGNPKKVMIDLLSSSDPFSCNGIAATGRRFRNFINLSSIPEPEAVELAFEFTRPPGIHVPAIVSAGGETFMVYMLDRSGRIINVATGNKCASGTGEFFLQQLRRMEISLDEAEKFAVTATPYRVSGRCSVFCKSDCTHATNKGIPKERVTAGLCRMMADKILELLKKTEKKNIMLTGGTSKNTMMVHYLRSEIENLIIPESAPYFEALGAALWAARNPTRPFPGISGLVTEESSSFAKLPPLTPAESMVSFKELKRRTPEDNDVCILGLDVGSTTTKAVLIRKEDNALLSSVYLRTGGDPVGASRRCYRAIYEDIKRHADAGSIRIIGLGVCGSGRQISGLHAFTEGVINEIIAHAEASVYFDSKVDTIFEIGGQDAKYTYIVNGVPSDYAMNEACSAGTGSFLEEAAYETMGILMEDIADYAVSGKNPPNFNDQCAAFISSDVKNAVHEGLATEDIIAGLVYSICMNYINRVKGNRPVGEKVFMQGGVCYNRAVPLAMATLLGKPIVVPPEPGLMGAFGAALVIKKRIETGDLQEKRFDLYELIHRDVSYGRPFICRGGKEKCDRKCEISVIRVNGKNYPFGGACNRYYNIVKKINHDILSLDFVKRRTSILFGASNPTTNTGGKRIGFNRSFMVHSYFPLYAEFFRLLGFRPVLPDIPRPEGIDLKNAAFCYPAELAHAYFYDLITKDPPVDFLFLPHFRAVPDMMGEGNSQVCPLAQGETFYLRSTFKEQLDSLKKKGTELITPLMDLTAGLNAAYKPLLSAASQMGISKKVAKDAFFHAVEAQVQTERRMKESGKKALVSIAPDSFAIVLFGRPYNAFASEANMGIPHKFASRGKMVIPFDFLEYEGMPAKRHMFWGTGQRILKAARLVKNDPRLYAVFISNFSCGPDSFVLGYFRQIMGEKPSLTLELDSHTADAGLETRIEAFLDIVEANRRTGAERRFISLPQDFKPAKTFLKNGEIFVVDSSGRQVLLSDPGVTLLFPSMGRFATEAMAAVFKGLNFKAVAHKPADETVLQLGRGNTSCKECLPLILTTGTLLNYLQKSRKKGEKVVYFFATGSGPCRFGQYKIFMEDLIKRLAIPDVALFALTADNAYQGLEKGFDRRGWWAIVAADVMEDIRSVLLATARDPETAMRNSFEPAWQMILSALTTTGDFKTFLSELKKAALLLSKAPLKEDPEKVPKILLTGEIFVRRDGLSRQYITERLAAWGFATICSPVVEWLKYCNFMAKDDNRTKIVERARLFIRSLFQDHYEAGIKKALAESGLIGQHKTDIDAVIKCAQDLISKDLPGEAILTVGSSLYEVASDACGVIAIGPFGCMPNRIAEAILTDAMSRETSPHGNGEFTALVKSLGSLPFLAIETDGSAFPQLIEARIESFCLHAKRTHEQMMKS